MKKIVILSLLINLFSIGGFSQGRNHDNADFDKFKAEKIAFITESIDLTPAEAEKFWPVYNVYEKKKWEIISERHKLERELQTNLKEMSNKEYTELSYKLAKFPSLEGELNTEYNKKFLEILSPKKVVQLYIAETSFRSKLLRRYRDKDQKPE